MQLKSDDELFAQIRRDLFSAVIGDVMDGMGLRRQFLPAAIRPMNPEMMIVGRAMPVLEADLPEDVGDDAPSQSELPAFGLMFEALDDLKPFDIYVCSGASPSYAVWGELMSIRAGYLNSAGAILDGYHRDSQGILSLNFPVFSRGAYAQDQLPRGHVVDFRVPIQCGAAQIAPGDILFADRDGVCVIPRHAERDVLSKALEKVHGERLVKQALESGMSARDAFDRFGIM
ncbi:RraA family protein [Planctomicrobium sp. SH661]|uniref:RraA family protein n=1 Tax=Planctomicrobium sp. SH661 TaxID=3448124 RepID=UPI003F5BF139